MANRAQVLPYTPHHQAQEDACDSDWKARTEAKIASVLEKTNNIVSDVDEIKRKFAKKTQDVLTQVTVLSALSHRSNSSSD